MKDDLIFVSYSRHDSEFALDLANKMQKAGANVWMDQLNLDTGSEWDNEIEKALDEAKTLIVILSKAAVGSKHVKDEYSYALEQGMPVVPVLVEKCHVPFRLRRLHWADFTKDPKKGMHLLVRSLKLDKEIAEKLEVKDYYYEELEKEKKKKEWPLIAFGSVIILAALYWLISSVLPNTKDKFTGFALSIHHEVAADSLVLPGKGLVKLMFSDTVITKTLDKNGVALFKKIPNHVFQRHDGFKIDFVDPKGQPYEVRNSDSIYYLSDITELNIPVSPATVIEADADSNSLPDYGVPNEEMIDPSLIKDFFGSYLDSLIVIKDKNRLPDYSKILNTENIDEASNRYILAYGYFTLNRIDMTAKVLDSTILNNDFKDVDYIFQNQENPTAATQKKLQQVIDSYWLKAEAHSRLSQHDKESENYEFLVDIYSSYPRDSAALAELYRRTWFSFYKYSEFVKAEYYMKLRYDLVNELYKDSDSITGGVNGEYGILKRQMGDIPKAIEYLTIGLENAKKYRDSLHDGLADTYRILAVYHSDIGEYKKADSLMKIGRRIFGKSVPYNDTRWYNLYGNNVHIHRSRGDHTMALKYNDSMLLYCEQFFKYPSTKHAQAYRTKSNTLRKLKQYDEAIAMISKSIELEENLIGTDHRKMGVLKVQLGEYHYENGQYQLSFNQYKQAYEIYRKRMELNDVRFGLLFAHMALTCHQLGDEAKFYYYGNRAKRIDEAAVGNLQHKENLSKLVGQIDKIFESI